MGAHHLHLDELTSLAVTKAQIGEKIVVLLLRRLKAIKEFEVNVLLERALLESVISITWITLLLAEVLVLENFGRKVILLYISLV